MIELSPETEQKLRTKHDVTVDEVIECFINHTAHFLYDSREEHRTTPPTEWFIAETNAGRRLKVVFIQKDRRIVVKTAYEPTPEEERIYASYT